MYNLLEEYVVGLKEVIYMLLDLYGYFDDYCSE